MAVIRREVQTVSTSRADDAAFLALSDISAIMSEFTDARIVGGQMVALLLAAYPAAAAIPRRTADADAAISIELAGSGAVHDGLLLAGYEPTAGNSYTRGDRTIDLLIPAPASRFLQQEHGGRMFDAAPGVRLALAADPIVLDVEALLVDGSAIRFEARVPTPEVATVLKAYATVSRASAKDLIDLHNLLSMVDTHELGAIGGWALNGTDIRGSRRDAARILHGLAMTVRRNPDIKNSDLNPARLTALIRRHVSAP